LQKLQLQSTRQSTSIAVHILMLPAIGRKIHLPGILHDHWRGVAPQVAPVFVTGVEVKPINLKLDFSVPH
jgi:hypothetical protein